jgi:hypothetical protein
MSTTIEKLVKKTALKKVVAQEKLKKTQKNNKT